MGVEQGTKGGVVWWKRSQEGIGGGVVENCTGVRRRRKMKGRRREKSSQKGVVRGAVTA